MAQSSGGKRSPGFEKWCVLRVADAVGTRIWTLLQDHSDLQAVLQELLCEYEVNEETCARDLMDLVSAMAEKGLVQTASQ